MKNINDKKIELYEYFINTNNHHDLMKYAFELFGNPMFIFDPSYSITISCVDGEGNEYVTTKATNDINSKILLDNAESINNNDEVVVLTKDLEYPIMIKAICNRDTVLGYACIMAKNRDFNDDDKELLKIASNICAKGFSIGDYSNKMDNIFYVSLLDGTLNDKKEISNVLRSIGIENNEYRLGLIRTNNQRKIYKELLKIHKSGAIFMYKKDIVLLIGADSLDKELILKTMNSFNDGNDKAVMAVSDIYYDLHDLHDAYDADNQLIDLGTLISSNKYVYYYEDYIVQLVLKSIDNDKLESLIDYRIREIKRFDIDNKTTYLSDLYNYFKANRNINRAADNMFVHKNSIYYRLNKIQEKFNIDLEDDEDCFIIEFSLRIMDLIDKIK